MKKLSIVLSLIMLVALTAGMAFAADEKPATMEVITGEVVNVDVPAGTIIIVADDEEQMLQAEPKMLEGIDVGQNVKIEKSGDVVKSIKRVEIE